MNGDEMEESKKILMNRSITTERTVSFAHIVDESVKCGVMHGHNYKVVVDVNARMLNKGMIVDFTSVKKIIDELDHKLVLSNKQYTGNDKFIANGKEYVVPVEEQIMVDVPYITAEYLSSYFAKRILNVEHNIFAVSVEVFETDTSSAVATYTRDLTNAMYGMQKDGEEESNGEAS